MSWVIGDVHGQFEMLDTLLEELRIVRGDSVIFLGDLIDRGDDSKRVVDLILLLRKEGHSLLTLRGNHEDMLLRARSNPTKYAFWWLRNGGNRTLASYKLESGDLLALPSEHVDLFRTSPLSYLDDEGNYYVHAGILPGLSIHEQCVDKMLWVREEFTECEEEHLLIDEEVKRIIHGHTPTKDPHVGPKRINLDTGAFSVRYGHLTAFNTDSGEIVSVSRSFKVTRRPT